VALSWAPSGKRSRERPRETWWRTVEKERAELGLTLWAAVAAVAKKWDRWRALISGPIPHPGARNLALRKTQMNKYLNNLHFGVLRNSRCANVLPLFFKWINQLNGFAHFTLSFPIFLELSTLTGIAKATSKLTSKKEKVKSAYEWLIRSELRPNVCSLKRLGVSPEWNASPSQGCPQH